MSVYPGQNRWLVWLALAIILIAGGLIAVVQSTAITPEEAANSTRIIIMVTSVLIGVIIISATSRFWIHR